ncbi:TPA: DUF167 domain-containing protein [Candidatus Woesearchaeota archaeon]|nr:hypothetical protein [archaeon]HIJ10735.1 DUF167 domain-containing protein [Candidatus Woesearchaeota archaeon]|tara:strand:- start:4 stop:252 length:249 start_codon:yes stop_codon:yes gene_type:complete
MDIADYIIDDKVRIKVIPNSSRTELVDDNRLKLYLKAVPEKNKANMQIITFFKKKFNRKVLIKSGLKSREKVLLVIPQSKSI